MPAPTVIVITDGSLKLADDEAGLTLGEPFECQVTEAAINAVPNLETVPATFCAPESQSPAATGYSLAVTWLQDWTAPAGGLSGYAFTHDTEEKWFELKLDKDDTTPIAVGQVRIVAGAFGGAAGIPLPASAEWPLAGKPDITMPAAAGMAADEPEFAVGVALADTAAKLRAVPAAALEDAAAQLTAYAEQVGGQVGPHRLGARYQVTGEATATATIAGTPTAPWVWINDGTGAHVIGTRRGAGAALLLRGAAHPITPPVVHPGATGRGAWREVARYAADLAPTVVAEHVHQAVGNA